MRRAKKNHNAPWGTAFAFGIVTFLAALAGVVALPYIATAYRDRAQQDSTASLRLVVSAVNNAVERIDPLPAMIAEQPALIAVLKDPDNQGLVPFVNEKLRLAARALKLSDIFLMDPNGRTVAASNYRAERSFVGRNFNYRPYFQIALSGGTARFHALGTTSSERGFYVSAPVLEGIDVVGVLAVKVTVASLESEWAGQNREILVADPNGVIFLSNRPELRLRALAPLSPSVRERIAASEQFPLDALKPLAKALKLIAPGAVELDIDFGAQAARYLTESAPLDLPGWHAIVLAPLAPIRQQALLTAGALALAALALLLVPLFLLQRQAQITERARIEEAHRLDLEERVQTRTAELDAANEDLRHEIDERRAAEAQLRDTQKELVQTGKLAALGQMSAALSHEINQPLAAVRAYADNAAAYLDRDRVTEARANIGRISEMTDRMAKISGHLRNFARRPGDTLKPVPVIPMIEEVIGLLEPHMRKQAAEIQFTPPDHEVWVIGGPTRLQQVLVNVLNNALDAMAGAPVRRIEIDVVETQTSVEIRVQDTGPGFADGIADQLFEPFFTTKTGAQGMGLGLSISHNIIKDFGGEITASNHPDGGALFQVRLRRTTPNETGRTAMVAE